MSEAISGNTDPPPRIPLQSMQATSPLKLTVADLISAA
jgi:hypothetical protein